MKTLKLTKKGKKIIGVLAAIASLLIIFLVFLLISLKTDTSKTYDVERLKSILIGEYEDLSLIEMDQMDLVELFALEKSEIPNSLLLKNRQIDEEGNNVGKACYIILINTEKYQYYYDVLASQIDAMVKFSEVPEEVELYSNAIIKSDANYVYMIACDRAKEIEEIINE